MFQNSGLSLDQAPPISVVLRFFLAGSLWGISVGFWLLYQGGEALNPAASSALILTHLLTLGVMLSFMLGALFQMLPVLAGVSLPNPTLLAMRSQWTIIFGTLLLLTAFATMKTALYILALLLLGAGVLPIAWRMLRSLLELQSHSASSRGMGFALFNLFMLFLVAIWMIAVLTGQTSRPDLLNLRQAHIGFGLFGWIALLIVSVSFQVIEMFYVTKPYPKGYARLMPAIVSGLLTLEFIAALNAPWLIRWCELLIAATLILHSLMTLTRLFKRKRALSDATIRFWSTAMLSLIFAMLLVGMGGFIDLSTPLREMSYALYTSFALSVIFAMSYKIVPFLVWFHLNAQGYFNAPMMHEVIHPDYSMRHLYIHLCTLFVALVAPWSEFDLWSLVGALLSLSFGFLAFAIYRAWHQYLEVQASGERFEFPNLNF